jgi:hypothetical protein
VSKPLPLETDPQDLLLDEDGDLVIGASGASFVSGIDAIVQGIQFRLRMWLGEWFLNQDIGIPYFEELIGDASKTPGVEDRARAVFGAAILDTPGVLTILRLDVTIDRSTRKMTVSCQAKTAYGNTPVVQIEVP